MNVRHNEVASRITSLAWPVMRILAAALAALAMLLAVTAGHALAAVPSGTLTIRGIAVDADDRPVTLVGDTWSIARVADATAIGADPAAITYATTAAFADPCDGVDWTTLTSGESRDLASRLAGYAAEHGLYRQTATADAYGTARFGTLPAGLYLLTRTGVAQDGESCATMPMLVGVPAVEAGGIVYDVTVDPKYECPGTPTPTPEPEEPAPGGGTPAGPGESAGATDGGKDDADDDRRPMAVTGSAILGALILTIGLMMTGCMIAASRRRHDDDTR